MRKDVAATEAQI